ncbi:MAG TPA: hypothetical protein VFS00_33980 [Polyangiaceae bacterium]|nr:hypothetical protein [Polyangiaceae bacterium]
MRSDPPSKRLLWAGLAASALLALLVTLGLRSKGGDGPGPAGPAGPAGAPGSATAPVAAGPPPTPPAPGGEAPASSDGVPPEPRSVDLEKLRAMLPDNTYWRLGVPTKDPAVLRERADEARRTNELYGKVLSNTASEEEIRRYYDGRRKVSEDYLEFAVTALKEYGPDLPEQERGLYELSVNMHRSRLREIPKQIDDALARKAVQDRRREEWKRGESN